MYACFSRRRSSVLRYGNNLNIFNIFCTLQIMSTAQESSKSFFAQWASQCLPEDGKYKSLELQEAPDSNKVDVLLTQFGPEGELKMR